MIDKRTIQNFQERLERELATLELELMDIGRINPANKNDWEGTPGVFDVDDTPDPNIIADRFEETTTNNAIVEELEERYNSVKKALDHIKNDTYGVCEVCGEEISMARLEVNPAATTCITHTK